MKRETNGEKPASDTNVDTKWNGKGMPPVGIEVEVLHDGRWIGAYTVGVFGCHKKYMVCAPTGGGFYGFYTDEIRPTQSERDVLVEKAADAMRGTEVNLTGSHLQVLSRQLIDAGWRPIKPLGEDGFIEQVCEELIDYVSSNQLADLYRAGCRFLDQGE